jgi:mannose-6-phosphate isomerase-like protein (cupin superfamily)/type 1 glutamine amidotransferase
VANSRHRSLTFLAWVFALALVAAARAAPGSSIVLIGGTKSEGPAQHDYPNGIRVIEAMLEASPDVRAHAGLTVAAYPDGWPMDPAALADAAAIVLYFDGLDKHPLTDASHRAQFESAMRRGAGLVALHQATTVPADDTSSNLQRWLGGARYGMFDRATELVKLEPGDHAVSRGLAAFTYRDEFYPTLRFVEDRRRVATLLSGKLHVEFREGRDLVLDQPTVSTVAWAYERDEGGRSVGYTGAHYLASLDEPALRRFLLNAVLWTARLDVPKDGARDELAQDTARGYVEQNRRAQTKDRAIREAIVTRPSQNEVIEQPWGRLTWYVSGELGNSETMTVGQAVIRPGHENPRHYHPNCDEVLRVVQGRIRHTMGDRTVEMSAGDVVSIPMGTRHNARNIGTENAVLDISFSSADRQVIGE